MQKLKAIHIIIVTSILLLTSCEDDFIKNIEADQSFGFSGKWENAGEIPGERCGALAGVYNNHLYAIAGKDYSGFRTDSWKFSFEKKDSQFLDNTDYRSFATISQFQNDFYIFGGYTEKSDSEKIYSTVDHCVTDFETDTFDITQNITTAGDTPAARYLHTSFTDSDCFYILGGTRTNYLLRMVCILFHIDHTLLIDFYGFDIRNSTWNKITVASGPINRSMHGSVKSGDKVYLYGGMTDSCKVLGDLWILDLQNYTWREIKFDSETPGPRGGVSLREIDGRIYLFGGFNEDMNFLDDLWCYYPDKKKWVQLHFCNQGPEPRAFYHMDVYNNKLLIYSGYCNTGDPVYYSDIWLYSPGKNEQDQ